MFLRANDIRIKPRLIDMQNVIIAVAEGAMDYDSLVAWIEQQH